MKLRPLFDVLVVRLDPAATETSGGIVLPGTSPSPIRTGVVVRAGPGRHTYRAHRNRRGMSNEGFRPTDVRVGERVVFLAALLDTQQGKQVGYWLGDGVGLIHESDVLMACSDPTVKIEV